MTHAPTAASQNAPAVTKPAAEAAALPGARMSVGISALGAWAIGVGGNIGSFAFLIHGVMIAQAGPLGAIIAWALATMMALPLALVLAELASMFPSAGGPYYYKYVAMKRLLPRTGELIGFLTGWLFWMYVVAGFACMGDGFANLMSSTFYGSQTGSPVWFGPLVIFALFGSATLVNLLQVSYASRLNTFFTLVKLGIAIAFGLLAATAPGFDVRHALCASNPHGNANLFANVACVLPLAICGFSGIEFAGCTASETRDARRNVPVAIISCVLTVSVIYITLCAIISCVAPYTVTADGTMATIAGTQVLATVPSLGGFIGGALWKFILTAGVISAIFSCGMAGLLANARTSLSMAETGLFPAQFARLNPITRVPDHGLIFQFFFIAATSAIAYVCSRVGWFADAYAFLGNASSILYATLAMLYGVCLVSLRYTDPEMERPFKLGNNLVAWMVAIVSFCVFGFIAFGCTQWMHQLTALILMLLGLPIYWYYRWRRPNT